MTFNFFDIHSHIQDPQFDTDRDAVIARMKEKRVGAIVVGTDWKMSQDAVALAEKYDFLWAAIGQHPTDNHTEQFDPQQYNNLARHPKVVAIGECGLDYYRSLQHVASSEELKDKQKKLFRQHIDLALAVQKPLIVHCRDAYPDALEILTTYYIPHTTAPRVDTHFFTGTWEEAQKFQDLGCSLSFSGVITFASDYDRSVRRLRLDHIMSETDCPYVAPVPYRGKKNEPVYVEEVVKRIAALRGDSFELVKKAMVDNALAFFTLRA